MALRTGTSGDNSLLGTMSDDVFDASQGGSDTLAGLAGNDLFILESTFGPGDSISGGIGSDTLSLDGDYEAQLTINSTMLNGVERIDMAPAYSYSFALLDGVVASGKALSFDGSGLGSADILRVDSSALTVTSSDATTVVIGGAARTFVTDGFGATILKGGDRQDIVYASTTYTASDRFDGGGGTDANLLHLYGDFSSGLNITGGMLKNFQAIFADGGFDYRLALTDSVVAAGQLMQINGMLLTAKYSLKFDGSQESDGSFSVFDGAGNDWLKGGANADNLRGTNGGNDRIFGMGGNDDIDMAHRLTSADRIDGGDGNDQLDLSGYYTTGVVLGDATIRNIETIQLSAGYNYKLTMSDGNVAAGERLAIMGSGLGPKNWIDFDGSKETNGAFDISGGGGSDVLTGGAGADTISGALNRDVLTGNGGSDTFNYSSFSDSQGSNCDRITDFDVASDRFHFGGSLASPTAVDKAVGTGHLDTASFLPDLTAALGSIQLSADHAVIFTADSGDLAGHSYLVVDENGTAGYQASGDLLIDITGATNLASFGISDFI